MCYKILDIGMYSTFYYAFYVLCLTAINPLHAIYILIVNYENSHTIKKIINPSDH